MQLIPDMSEIDRLGQVHGQPRRKHTGLGNLPDRKGRMDLQKLADYDLNLLVVLERLLAERSLTRAARQLGRTQSALSHSLARLRELFEDPLFVRSAEGLVPTARAEALAPQVQAVLAQVQSLLKPPRAFDPQHDSASLAVVMTDYVQLVLLPPLLRLLAQEAPGLELRILTGSDAIEAQLETGEADLGFGVIVFERPELYQRVLFEERFSCLVRADHPLVQETLSLETFLTLSHILVTPRGRPGSFVDAALEARGLRRRVVLRVPQYMVVPELVANTDLVVTLPERVARWGISQRPLQLLEPPLPLPTFSTRMLWHARRQLDPACVYLRQVVTRLLPALQPSRAP